MGQPDPPQVPNPAKSYEQGIQVYLKYLPQLLAAEQAGREQYDPQRVQEQIDLQNQFGPTQYAQQLAGFEQLDPQYVANRNALGTQIGHDLSLGSSIDPATQSQIENY